MDSLLLGVLLVSAAAFGSAGSSQSSPHQDYDLAGVRSARLTSAEGALRHLFSVSFTLEPSTSASLVGLDSITRARTAEGGLVDLTLDPGTPFPTRVTRVVLGQPGNDPNSVVEPTSSKVRLTPCAGQKIVAMSQVPGVANTIVAWRDGASNHYGLSLAKSTADACRAPVIARSSMPILGIATQPAPHGGPTLTVIVWTRGSPADQVVASMYDWTPAAGRPAASKDRAP